MHPDSFHIQSVFEIIKALLHDIFITINLQGCDRILDVCTQQGKKAAVLIVMPYVSQ